MKKYSIVLLLSLGSIVAFGQNPEIKTDLPTLISPSPTVAALMKFEEVPVSNYTGIPDISIPLFNSPTYSKDINLDISLKYHSGSNAANEFASDAGLGWSLFAGGTISRTVRGMPDEMLKLASPHNGNGSVGIYHTTLQNYTNAYYEIASNPTQTTATENRLNEFLWESLEKNKYDSEHDLWQYNFMGYSGRFIIKKNISTGVLEVYNQDLKNTLKIINNYNGTTYTPNSFTIFDDKGYKYVFDIKEETTVNNSNYITYYGFGLLSDYDVSVSMPLIYISSFQLSKVYDNNMNLLLDFIYNPENELMREIATTKSHTVNEMIYTNPNDLLNQWMGYSDTNFQGQNKKLEPKDLLSVSTRITNTRKVKEIDAVGFSKIFLNYESGREDQNSEASSYRIKSLTLKDWNNTSIKKFELFHSYSTVIEKRMMLDKVVQSNFINNKIETYNLFYEQNPTNGQYVGKDYWGYFNLHPINNLYADNRGVTPSFCTTDILQKMTLPTGGSMVFDFESNQYSYIGNVAIPDFDENPENWIEHSTQKTFCTVQNNKKSFFTINDAQSVTFKMMVDLGSNNLMDWRFNLYKVGTNDDEFITNLDHLMCEESDCVLGVPNLQPGEYKIEFSSIDMGFPSTFSSKITAFYKTRSGTNKQYLYGGGNRIRRIGIFDTSAVPQNFYKDYEVNLLTYQPKKEKNYKYTFFDNSLKTSGSLVYGKPIYDYLKNKACYAEFTCTSQIGGATSICFTAGGQFTYHCFTDFNNLQNSKTQGSDIGYQNISVYEINNGKTEYIYSSPIDTPENEDAYSTAFPFYPSENLDYQRGLLYREKVYHNDGRPLQESIYDYDIIEETHANTLTGIRPHYLGWNFPYGDKFISYFGSYQPALNTCTPGSVNFPCNFLWDLPITYMGYKTIFEAFGWAKLKERKTVSYHYNGSIRTDVETTEKYTYNPLNKRIASQTATNSNGEILKSDFTYHTGNSTFSQNRIAEIEKVETFRASNLLSTSKINYTNTFANNVSYLPQSIDVSKGTQSLETRLKYNKYDEFGHPLEVQQEGGMKISYIWGYNKTQPVAKIENMDYANIPTNLITAIETATTEPLLISALQLLRIDNALANAQVTSYTYTPLVGISTVTDPKGNKMTYSYDEFGRLKQVKDQDNNILSENEYHYKTQN